MIDRASDIVGNLLFSRYKDKIKTNFVSIRRAEEELRSINAKYDLCGDVYTQSSDGVIQLEWEGERRGWVRMVEVIIDRENNKYHLYSKTGNTSRQDRGAVNEDNIEKAIQRVVLAHQSNESPHDNHPIKEGGE